VQDREELQEKLASSGIGTGIHYPVPLHLQDAYRHLGYAKGSFPVSEKIASEILSLPMYPQLRQEQIRRVAQALSGSFSSPRIAVSVLQPQPTAQF
jgi:dTDP-4-amino-4,6-dideoxygalactose transaminase